jgi:DNA-binding NarL/FixJ family response regulator
MWVSKGLLEDLARLASKGEKNYELLGVVTETKDARDFLTSGVVDIVILGHGRLQEWSQMWRDGVFRDTPQFCAMLISTIPVSTATLMEASEVGIFDVADLTMDRDVIGQRMNDLFAQLRRDIPMQNEILDSHVEQYRLLKDISDVTDRKILQRISQGKFDREISQELFLSLQTIRNRVSRMLTESGARNRTHLAVLFTSEKAMDITSQSQAQDLNDSGNHDQVA